MQPQDPGDPERATRGHSLFVLNRSAVRSAGGQPPESDRLANVLALLLAYAVCLVAAALALGAFFTGRPLAAGTALAAGAIAFWLILQGERALDAQLVEEF